jgi:hypothetical protein
MQCGTEEHKTPGYVIVCTVMLLSVPSCYCVYRHVTVCTVMLLSVPSCYCLYHHIFLILFMTLSLRSRFVAQLLVTQKTPNFTVLYRLISRLEMRYRKYKGTGIDQLLIVIIQTITFRLGCSLDDSRFGSHYRPDDQTGPGAH